MPKVRKAELSFLYMTHRLVLFYISAKYHRNIPKVFELQNGHEIFFQIKQRVVTPKVIKVELYATRLVLVYIFTKYHQNIPKGIQVTEGTRSFTPTLTPTGSVPKTICAPTLAVGDIIIPWSKYFNLELENDSLRTQ